MSAFVFTGATVKAGIMCLLQLFQTTGKNRVSNSMSMRYIMEHTEVLPLYLFGAFFCASFVLLLKCKFVTPLLGNRVSDTGDYECYFCNCV